MTIKLQQIVTDDLYTAVDTLKFDRVELKKHVQNVPELSAVTFLATRVAPTDKLADLVHACGKKIIPFLKNNGLDSYRLLLFVAHGPWQPDMKLTRYKRLWKGHPGLKKFSSFPDKSDEIEISSDSGIRYTGLIELHDEDQLLQAIEFIRNDRASCIIVSRRQKIFSPEAIQEIFAFAFPKDQHDREATTINWFSLVGRLAPKGDLILRVFGNFDDIEVSIDIFKSSDMQ